MAADKTELSIFEFADAVNDVLFAFDQRWRFVFLSRQAVVLWRQPIENLLGRTLWETTPAVIDTPLAAAYRKAMAERMAVHVEHPSLVSDRWYDVHVYPYRDGIAVYGRDITARKLAEQALRTSEERLRTQYDNLPIPTYTWQKTQDSFKLINFNTAAAVISNGTTQHVMGKQLDDLFGDVPVLLEAVWKCWEQRKTIRRELRYEYRFTPKSRDLSLTCAFVPPDMVIVHTEDVTNQKDAERKLTALNETLEQRIAERTAELEARTRQLEASEKTIRASEEHYKRLAERNHLLAEEVEHRVGNNLTGLIGLVDVMRNQAYDLDGFASAIDARLKAMAHVHKILTASEWRGADLHALAASTLQAVHNLAPHPTPAQLEGPDFPLDQRQAYALALILTEWFTNSCKYGAHSVPGGQLRIAWSIAEMAGGRGVRFSWTERGGPPPAAQIRPSLGMLLARQFSTRELGGNCEMRFPPEGAEHVIEFLMADLLGSIGPEKGT